MLELLGLPSASVLQVIGIASPSGTTVSKLNSLSRLNVLSRKQSGIIVDLLEIRAKRMRLTGLP